MMPFHLSLRRDGGGISPFSVEHNAETAKSNSRFGASDVPAYTQLAGTMPSLGIPSLKNLRGLPSGARVFPGSLP